MSDNILNTAQKNRVIELFELYDPGHKATLTDGHGRSNIYLDGISDNELILTINNISIKPSNMSIIGHAPQSNDENNYHFKVSFPSAFKVEFGSIEVDGSDDWEIKTASNQEYSASLTNAVVDDYLYFLYKGNEAITVDWNSSYKIKLSYNNVSDKSSSNINNKAKGPRPLSIFSEIAVNNDRKYTLGFPQNPLSYTTIHLKAQPKKSDSPFFLYLENITTIVNDNNAHSLTLVLENISSSAIILDDSLSKFIISFAYVQNIIKHMIYPWALSNTSAVQTIDINPDNSTDWSTKKNKSDLTWEILPSSTKKIINSNEKISLTISNIATDFAPGFANIYLRYANIGQYQDRTLVTQLEKTPIIYKNVSGSGITCYESITINHD